MFKVILVILLLIPEVLAQPFGPPLFIGNQETGECKYYFAGDDKHFNPRPENFTFNIGYTTNFKNVDEACELWKCYTSNGLWKDSCYCPKGKIWDNVTGCIYSNEANLITTNAVIGNKFFKFDSIIFSSLIFIILALLLYSIFLNSKIRKLKKNN